MLAGQIGAGGQIRTDTGDALDVVLLLVGLYLRRADQRQQADDITLQSQHLTNKKKSPRFCRLFSVFHSIPYRHFIQRDRIRPGLDSSRFSKPRRVEPLVGVLPGLAMVQPFRDAIEPGPPRPGHAGQPVALALIEEVFAPAAIPLHQQLFVRTSMLNCERNNCSLATKRLASFLMISPTW